MIDSALGKADGPRMMTALQCLAKAAEMDSLGARCGNAPDRKAFITTADGWRATAVLARKQEAWDHRSS